MNIDFFDIDPTSLETLRDSLYDEGNVGLPDFISILENHHDYLKESIAILLHPETSTFDKQENLARFLLLLDMHGHAEEQTLYRRLKSDPDKQARVEGLVGEDEHDLAYQLMHSLRHSDFEERWNDEIEAAAKVIAGLVKNHIEEEETTKFPLAKKLISDRELTTLSEEYVMMCREYFEENYRMMPVDNPEVLQPRSPLI